MLYLDSGGDGPCADSDNDGVQDDSPTAGDNYCENAQMLGVLQGIFLMSWVNYAALGSTGFWQRLLLQLSGLPAWALVFMLPEGLWGRSLGKHLMGLQVVQATLPQVVRDDRAEMTQVVYTAATKRAILMPDLRGRSVRDAARVCAQLGLQLEAKGEGRALRQSPQAGAEVEMEQIVHIDFGRSGK